MLGPVEWRFFGVPGVCEVSLFAEATALWVLVRGGAMAARETQRQLGKYTRNIARNNMSHKCESKFESKLSAVVRDGSVVTLF